MEGLDGGRPIILPSSNPSKLIEVLPEDANNRSGGKGIIGHGEPIP
jgi:malate dehydrogenase (oxaloacetate-decarboxylating)